MPVMGLEWIWIVLIVIIFLVGPKKLPEVARAVGKAMGEFQKARQQIDTEFKSASQQVDNEVKSVTQAATDYTSIDTENSDSESSDRKKLFNAAQALGIFPYGKTNDELSQMIKEKVDEKKESVPIVQEGGEQLIPAMMAKTVNPKSDSSVNKPIGQKRDVDAKRKTSEQKPKKTDMTKGDDNSKVAKKKINTRASSKSQSKTSPRNRKPRTR